MTPGRIINPKTARSQAIGGIIWGVGQVLLGQTETDPVLARFLNRNFSGYLVPTNADIPNLDVLFVGAIDVAPRAWVSSLLFQLRKAVARLHLRPSRPHWAGRLLFNMSRQ